MLTILCRDNGLSERSLKEPTFLNPFGIKSGIDALEMEQKLLQDFVFLHLEEGIIHGPVVAKIDEMAATVFGGRLIIGMLNKTGKRIAWIAGIDPIAIGKLAIQGEYEALRAICLPPITAGTIIGGRRWYEAAGETGSHRGDHAISRPGSLVGANLPTPVIQR